MAIQQVSTLTPNHIFIGESLDIKPGILDYPSLMVGDQFHELNTGIKYLWDGVDWRIYNLLELTIAQKLGV
jgi:hypothetical protein